MSSSISVSVRTNPPIPIHNPRVTVAIYANRAPSSAPNAVIQGTPPQHYENNAVDPLP